MEHYNYNVTKMEEFTMAFKTTVDFYNEGITNEDIQLAGEAVMTYYDPDSSRSFVFSGLAAGNILYFYDKLEKNYEIKLTFSGQNFVSIENHLDSSSGDDWTELCYLDISEIEIFKELFGEDEDEDEECYW